MKKLILFLSLITTQYIYSQNLGFNGAGFFENYSPDVEKFLLDLDHPFTLRIPGGAISQFHHPYEVRQGWGMTDENIREWMAELGVDENGEGADKWIVKRSQQPNYSYMDEMIKLQVKFPLMEVIYVLNVINPLQGTSDEDINAINYLIAGGVNIVGVESCNECYGKYPSFDAHRQQFEPVFNLIHSLYPYIKRSIAVGDAKNHWKWNQDAAAYASGPDKLDAISYHFYLVNRHVPAFDSNPKDYPLIAEQLFAYNSIGELLNIKDMFPNQKLWITESNLKPNDVLQNNFLNAMWLFYMLTETKDFVEYYLIHNGVSPDSYGLIRKRKNTDNQNTGMVTSPAYYAFDLAGDTPKDFNWIDNEVNYTLVEGDEVGFLNFSPSGFIPKLNGELDNIVIKFIHGESLDATANTVNTIDSSGEIFIPGYSFGIIKIVDESDTCNESQFYADADGDGFGNIDAEISACIEPLGYVSNFTDCNDVNKLINPDAAETCNGIDDNCSGEIDEGLSFKTYYLDADKDGYGNAEISQRTCSGAPLNYILDGTDWDDSNDKIHLKPVITKCDVRCDKYWYRVFNKKYCSTRRC